MIMTPRMWGLKKRIDFLKWQVTCDPGDYMAQFELDELMIQYGKLDTIERIGLKVLQGGQLTSSLTGNRAQIS